ncbi:ATP-binding protein [Sinomonas sp. ASV322]|uniref:sensor histidine kinase n=1 Tax=Sinomonas sp. ASV322 TaxID=3041920 RepID=UPI0027DE1A6E|nr:ATP-binding protein [Sinomonas sp. ASV322]MDQ4501747.1 ATP-binding protein [Sinomonas sp. ASV322]
MPQRAPLFPAPEHRLGLAQLGMLDRRRTLWGLALAVVLPSAVEAIVVASGYHNVAMTMLVQLAAAVAVAVVGGLWPAAFAAVVGAVLLNYFSVDPIGSFHIADPQVVGELAIFLAVACAVGVAVGAATRRYEQATRAQSDARAMAELARGMLGSGGSLEDFLERVRAALGLRAVTLLDRREPGTPLEVGPGWEVVASAGKAPPVTLPAADDVVVADEDYTLLAGGRALEPAERRMMEAFGAYLVAIRQGRQLASSREANRRLEEGNKIRTSILRAVSHDLRTPLSGIKLSVSSLRQPGVDFAPEDRAELLATIEDYTDRLSVLVGNLLDMSRISADSVTPLLRPVRWREGIPSWPGDVAARIEDRVADGGPTVVADPVLLERIVANLVENAVKHAPDSPIELEAGFGEPGPDGGGTGELRVIDHGAGIPPEQLFAVFSPFQRVSDSGGQASGIGLGLAVAKGFAEAMGGGIVAQRTPGGGLTMRVVLPLAEHDGGSLLGGPVRESADDGGAPAPAGSAP